MALVEGDRIARQQAPHKSRQLINAWPHQKVEMIVEQGPSIAIYVTFLNETFKTQSKAFTVCIVVHYCTAFNATDDNVLQ